MVQSQRPRHDRAILATFKLHGPRLGAAEDDYGRRQQLTIEAAASQCDSGRFPAKRIVGENALPRVRVFADNHDLLGERRFLWNGPRNFVELDPRICPAHVFRVRNSAQALPTEH